MHLTRLEIGFIGDDAPCSGPYQLIPRGSSAPQNHVEKMPVASKKRFHPALTITVLPARGRLSQHFTDLARHASKACGVYFSRELSTGRRQKWLRVPH